jgi:flagellar biosynthetic protein FlhB
MADTSDDRDERRLPASERRLRQAREDGQVPRSREAAHAAALLAALATAAVYGPAFAERTLGMVRGALRIDPSIAREPGRAMAFAAATAGEALWAVLPLLAAPLLAAAAATLAVGGLVFTFKPVTPDASRIDPFAGVRRLLSIESLIELCKLALLAGAVGAVGAWFAADGLARFSAYAGLPLPAALASAGADLRFGVLAVAGVQVWRHRQRLRMTPQEVRQELREAEGDPQLKGRIRERQRAMSRGRMLAAVPTADVVITNPTHYAVALKYSDADMAAPRVVAKGADLLAARIRELALEAGVPMLESPPLARALYRHVEVDREIPAALYAAVAQVLAWVWQLEQHVAGRGARPREPGIEVPIGLDPGEGRA